MPTTKYDPTKDFGYGAGKSLLYADLGKEQFEEAENL